MEEITIRTKRKKTADAGESGGNDKMGPTRSSTRSDTRKVCHVYFLEGSMSGRAGGNTASCYSSHITKTIKKDKVAGLLFSPDKMW